MGMWDSFDNSWKKRGIYQHTQPLPPSSPKRAARDMYMGKVLPPSLHTSPHQENPDQTPPRAKPKKMSRIQQHTVRHTRHTYIPRQLLPPSHKQHMEPTCPHSNTTRLPAVLPTHLPALADFLRLHTGLPHAVFAQGRVFCAPGGGRDEGRVVQGGYRSEGDGMGYLFTLCWCGRRRECFPRRCRYCYTGSVVDEDGWDGSM
jgi:hypothetical protein